MIYFSFQWQVVAVLNFFSILYNKEEIYYHKHSVETKKNKTILFYRIVQEKNNKHAIKGSRKQVTPKKQKKSENKVNLN